MVLTPPDPAWYAVEVTAGAYAWATEKGDPGDWGLADPLSVGWSVPENGLAYTQPDPMWARFTLALESVSDIADLDVGDPVAIFVTLDPLIYVTVSERTVVSFRGRVADVKSRARKAGGVLVAVTCVDYSVDLAETPIGTSDWPSEAVQPRTDRIAAEAGVAVPPTWPALIGAGITLAARPGALTDARAALVRMVDTAGGAAGGGYKLYLQPNYPVDALTDTAPDPLTPFEYWVEKVTEAAAGGQGAPYVLPGSLQLLSSGLWGIVVAERPADAGLGGVIDGDWCELGAEWSLSKNNRPDTIAVTGPYTLPTAGVTMVTAQTPDAVPITTVIDTDLLDYQYGQLLAELNLTTRDSDRWTFDEFTFYADLDPTRLTTRGWWFNDALFFQALKVPTVVSPIVEDQNPTGVDWLAGTIVSAVFTLAGGRFATVLRLSRNLPRPEVQVGANIGYLDAEQLATFAPGGSLIANPGFEVNAAGYTGSNANLARVTTQHHTGVGALSITAVAAGTATAVDSGSGVGGKPVVAGRAYRVPAWFKTAVTARICQLRVDWYNAAGAFLSQSVGPGTVSDAAGAWTDFTQVFLAPAGAAFARRQFLVAGVAAGEVHYLDDADMWRTLTPADLDPRFSAYDYRIVRNPNA